MTKKKTSDNPIGGYPHYMTSSSNEIIKLNVKIHKIILFTTKNYFTQRAFKECNNKKCTLRFLLAFGCDALGQISHNQSASVRELNKMC